MSIEYALGSPDPCRTEAENVIKDLVDLVSKLASSIDDRKFAGELREVQSMIGRIQSEHAELHEKRIELMTTNASLREEVAALKEQIADLRLELSSAQSPVSTGAARLDSECEKVLLIIAHNKGITAQRIASLAEIDVLKSQYWLDRLSDADLVYYPLIVGGGPLEYSVSSKGRAYVVEHGLQ